MIYTTTTGTRYIPPAYTLCSGLFILAQAGEKARASMCLGTSDWREPFSSPIHTKNIYKRSTFQSGFLRKQGLCHHPAYLPVILPLSLFWAVKVTSTRCDKAVVWCCFCCSTLDRKQAQTQPPANGEAGKTQSLIPSRRPVLPHGSLQINDSTRG